MKSIVLPLVLLTTSLIAGSQIRNARITIFVTDRDGRPMSDCRVVAKPGPGQEVILKESATEGEYYAEAPIGNYVVQASLLGFRTVERSVSLYSDLWTTLS